MQKELLFSVTKNDFDVQVFRAGGKGGQKQNKTSSGVRIIHRQSNARGESREERSQLQNKKLAFKRCVDSKEFQAWLKKRTAIAVDGIDKVKKKVEDSMQIRNLKVEVKQNNQWVQSTL